MMPRHRECGTWIKHVKALRVSANVRVRCQEEVEVEFSADRKQKEMMEVNSFWHKQNTEM